MRADIDRWNAKYGAEIPNPTFAPDPVLAGLVDSLRGGLALDVACGVAHNAMLLAQHGYEVLAVDGSLDALRHARRRLRAHPLPVHLVVLDLDRYTPPASRLDLIIMVRYLDRPLIARLVTGLRPGGAIFLKTFNTNYARERPAFRPEFLLRTGELRELVNGLEILDTNDAAGMSAVESHVFARRC